MPTSWEGVECLNYSPLVYAHGHNNDGIDIEMTKNVLVENCRFDQGDDAVVIKSGRNQDACRSTKPSASSTCEETREIR